MKLPRWKKALVLAAIAATVLMGLFPPWEHQLRVDVYSKYVSMKIPGTYAPIFAPPSPRPAQAPERFSSYWSVQIDLWRLILQWILLWTALSPVLFFSE